MTTNLAKSSSPTISNGSKSSVTPTNASKSSTPSNSNELRSLGDRWSTIATTWATEPNTWSGTTPVLENVNKSSSPTVSNGVKS